MSKNDKKDSRDNSRRHKPMSPPGGFSGKRSRYDEGGEINW